MDIWRGRADVVALDWPCANAGRGRTQFSKAAQQGLELCAVVVVLEEGGVWVCVIKLTILHQSCTGADFLITRKAARILSSFFFFSFFLSNVYERGHGSVLAMKNGGN
jgi:hypothetical protein